MNVILQLYSEQGDPSIRALYYVWSVLHISQNGRSLTLTLTWRFAGEYKTVLTFEHLTWLRIFFAFKPAPLPASSIQPPHLPHLFHIAIATVSDPRETWEWQQSLHSLANYLTGGNGGFFKVDTQRPDVIAFLLERLIQNWKFCCFRQETRKV